VKVEGGRRNSEGGVERRRRNSEFGRRRKDKKGGVWVPEGGIRKAETDILGAGNFDEVVKSRAE
jgi:hypothetical protein